MESGDKFAVVSGHPASISAITSHPATPAAVGTICNDGTLRLWDICGAGSPVQVSAVGAHSQGAKQEHLNCPREAACTIVLRATSHPSRIAHAYAWIHVV